MLALKNGNELKARLSALSRAKRAWREQRSRKQPIREGRATVVELQAGAVRLLCILFTPDLRKFFWRKRWIPGT